MLGVNSGKVIVELVFYKDEEDLGLEKEAETLNDKDATQFMASDYTFASSKSSISAKNSTGRLGT